MMKNVTCKFVTNEKGLQTKMGMAASQARLLSITSRMADNELRAQLINNSKMRLATESSKVSEDYISALNSATMMMTNYDNSGNTQYQNLTFNSLTAYSSYNNQYALVNNNGQMFVSETEGALFKKSMVAGDYETSLSNYLEAHGLTYGTSYFDEDGILSKETTTTIDKMSDTKGVDLITKDGQITYSGYEYETDELGKIKYDSDGNPIKTYNDTDLASFTIEEFEALYGEYETIANSGVYANYEALLENYLDAKETVQEKTKNTIVAQINNIFGTDNANVASTNSETYLNNLKNLTNKDYKTSEGIGYNGLGEYITLDENGNNEQLDDLNTKLNALKLTGSYGSQTVSEDVTNTINTTKTSTITTDKGTEGYLLDNLPILVTVSGGTLQYTPVCLSGDKWYELQPSTQTYGSGDDAITVDYDSTSGVWSNTTGDVTWKLSCNSSKKQYTTDSGDGNSTCNTLQSASYSNNTITTSTTMAYTNNSESCNPLLEIYCRDLKRIALDNVDYANYTSDDPEEQAAIEAYNEAKEALETFLGTTVEELAGQDVDLKRTNILEIYNAILSNGDTPNTSVENCRKFYVVDNVLNVFGEPQYGWIDEDTSENAEAKAQWYTNQFSQMWNKGYSVLENGLASSNSWIQFALESGLATMQQTDDSNTWQSILYSNCSEITEKTDEAATAKAEAEYNRQMNNIEAKDQRFDVELKNIDTEHTSLQTEYDSVKSVISKNVERAFKLYT